MTKEEIKNKLRTEGYCYFHISDFDEKYEESFKKHMIPADDSKYKKLMSGIRLDITNRELLSDTILSDLFDETGNSKMYNAGSYEEAELIKNYIRNTHLKEDIFQIWHWNAGDFSMEVENYYKPYFEKFARYFYDLNADDKLKFNSQFTMYSNRCFLQNHKDGKVDGRLCVVLLYLNEEYDKSNGGLLILNTQERVLPKIGNIAILDLGEFDIEHQVTEVVGKQNRYCVLSFISLKDEE
jgi:hypothetical protein